MSWNLPDLSCKAIFYVEVEVAVEEDDMVLVDLDSLALANDSSEVMETLRTPFSTLLLPMRESPFMTELLEFLDVSRRKMLL